MIDENKNATGGMGELRISYNDKYNESVREEATASSVQSLDETDRRTCMKKNFGGGSNGRLSEGKKLKGRTRSRTIYRGLD